MHPIRLLVIAGVCLVFLSVTLSAGAPSTFSYQGRLTNATGVPVADGPYTLTFSLWTDPVNGTQVWTENQEVQCTKGLFSAELGKFSSFFDVFADYSDIGLYLQVQVNIRGSIETIDPRTPMSSVPYAQGARRVVDDTVSTSGLAIFAGVAIPRFISITNEATKSSISIDEPGVHRCVLGTEDGPDGASSVLEVIKKGAGTRAGGIRMNETQCRFFIHQDDDNDGVGEVGTEATSSVSRSVLKSYFQSGDTPTETQIVDSVDETGAHNELTADLDGDGLAESSVSSSSRASDASLAIKTKGTGAQRYQAGGDCDDTDAEIYAGSDNDDDGIEEARVTIQARDALGNPGSSLYLDCDSDDDGVSERQFTVDAQGPTISSRMSFFDVFTEMSITDSIDASSARHAISTKGTGTSGRSVEMSTDASSARLAIKTKGTSAHRSQVGGDCDDTDAEFYASSDNDDDGVSEARASIQARDALGNPGSSLYLDCDSDDDGISERTFTVDAQGPIITSRMSFFDVFADFNITDSIDATGARHYFGHSQGATHGGLRMASQPGLSSFGISEPGVQMAFTVGDNGSGTNTGEIQLEVSGSKTVSIHSDGTGYLSSALGIGVPAPIHPIEHSSTAHLTAGGLWTNASDANLKENFQEVDGEELLKKIEDLPISRWNYKVESDDITHIGPTAQDFREVFGIGENDKTISTIDPSGIALAAIKQLKKENTELRKEIDELKKLVTDLASKKN